MPTIKPNTASRRDVPATKRRLVKAALEVLAQEGFQKLGVNRVAREAGVDKVLIYRYFGGLEGLLEQAAASADFWPSFDELVGDADELAEAPLAQAVASVLKRYARGIQKRPLALEILSWETLARTEHTAVFESVREELGLKLGQLLAQRLGNANVDAPAIVAILSGAINYLSIRRRNIRVFNDVEINTDPGWQRIETSIDAICAAMFGE